MVSQEARKRWKTRHLDGVHPTWARGREREAWHQKFRRTRRPSSWHRHDVFPARALPLSTSAAPQSHFPKKDMFVRDRNSTSCLVLKRWSARRRKSAKREREWGLNYSHLLFLFSEGCMREPDNSGHLSSSKAGDQNRCHPDQKKRIFLEFWIWVLETFIS